MEELMTIGSFASHTRLSVSALRFYAGQGLLVPAEVDSVSGYRRYARAQVKDGLLICNLRRMEMPLAEIALALKHPEPERKELIERHLRRLEQVVRRAHTLAQTIDITTSTRETPMSTTLQTHDLTRALDQVLPAAGTDPELPHLMGVLIEGKEGSIRLVATDRFRLAIRDLVPSSLDRELSAVVPAATLSQWRTSLDAPAELTLSIDERHLSVVGDDIDLTALVLPTTFPDYDRLLVPADDMTRLQTDRQQLLAALEGFDDEQTVIFSAVSGSLRLGPEGGDEPVVEIGASRAGDDQRTAINARFAIDATRHAIGAEIVIDIEDPLSPVLFRSADDGTFTSRIMPVTLD